MIKKLFILILILVASAFALVYFFGAGWVTQAVETFGPKITQTSVRLDEVKLSPLSGSGTLRGLYIGNPKGYKKEHIFSLSQIDVEMETKSLLSDQIIVKKIHIRSPEMSYEKTLRSSNLNGLLAKLESFSRPAANQDPAQEAPQSDTSPVGATEKQKASKKILIRELLIEDLRVSVDLMGAATSVTIPEIDMQDLDSGSTTELVSKVLQVVLNEVTRQLGSGVSGLGKDALSGLDAVSKQALSQENNELLKRAEKEIENVQKEIENAVDPELVEGIKKLFGN